MCCPNEGFPAQSGGGGGGKVKGGITLGERAPDTGPVEMKRQACSQDFNMF